MMIDRQFPIRQCFIRDVVVEDDRGVPECGDDELIVNWPCVRLQAQEVISMFTC
jgi:hypothetical protein